MNVKSVELLLAKGADVNCHETKRGRSALHIAVKKQSEEMVTLLLSCVCITVLCHVLKLHGLFFYTFISLYSCNNCMALFFFFLI